MEIPRMMKHGEVLDVGVGEGKNALFLSKKGFKVTGIDISDVAVKKFKKFAKKQKLVIKGIVEDIIDFKFSKNYEVIICTAVLHLINRPLMVINKIKKHTKKGGINLITIFTEKDIGFKEYPSLQFLKGVKLKELYGDWKILKYKNYIKIDAHGKTHKHNMAVLIAKNCK
jgi:tellurite methyltransferase